ncbi:GAF domain-containing protein [Microvirga sp. GCM10011540]|uniref:GAF domain-containing protein n=1 Tax=Microvirga sp. GCM10011540 TaxID=3317338 RepID=UPI003614CB83
MDYPVGPHEEERLTALLETGILDTASDPAFDAITGEAQRHFDVPMCLVTLLDRDRQWIKSAQGICLPETPRDIAFCNYTILSDEVFVVEDARADDRFKSNPAVTGDMGIRFYAGAPLIYMKNIRLGALCLLDTKPRTFSRGDRAELQIYAERVVAEIAAREFTLHPSHE